MTRQGFVIMGQGIMRRGWAGGRRRTRLGLEMGLIFYVYVGGTMVNINDQDGQVRSMLPKAGITFELAD